MLKIRQRRRAVRGRCLLLRSAEQRYGKNSETEQKLILFIVFRAILSGNTDIEGSRT